MTKYRNDRKENTNKYLAENNHTAAVVCVNTLESGCSEQPVQCT